MLTWAVPTRPVAKDTLERHPIKLNSRVNAVSSSCKQQAAHPEAPEHLRHPREHERRGRKNGTAYLLKKDLHTTVTSLSGAQTGGRLVEPSLFRLGQLSILLLLTVLLWCVCKPLREKTSLSPFQVIYRLFFSPETYLSIYLSSGGEQRADRCPSGEVS